MDIFNLFNWLNWQGNSKRHSIGGYIATLLALLIFIPGVIYKSIGVAHDVPGFWHWLWHGETVIDPDFSNAQGRTLVADLNDEWRIAFGDYAGWASPDFDDSSWPRINASDNWEDQG